MDALNNIPKPVIIIITIIAVLLAGYFIFQTVSSVSTNGGYGSKEDIVKRQQGAGGRNAGHTETNGH